MGVEERQSDEVKDKADDADIEQRVGVLDGSIAGRQALYRLDNNGETQRQQEHGVD